MAPGTNGAQVLPDSDYGLKNIQCSGALFIISVTRSGAEPSGDVRKVQGTFYNLCILLCL